jgi:hypothetical protein
MGIFRPVVRLDDRTEAQMRRIAADSGISPSHLAAIAITSYVTTADAPEGAWSELASLSARAEKHDADIAEIQVRIGIRRRRPRRAPPRG